jgi:flavin-dependent dehydrogenase
LDRPVSLGRIHSARLRIRSPVRWPGGALDLEEVPVTGSETADAASETYDVVIAGAGIAGCTAATLYGRQGLRVALVEAHQDAAAFKRLCTHYIQASATPVLQRLGIDEAIEAAGGVPNSLDMWSPFGWITAERNSARTGTHGYNIRRSVLDPMLRRMAAETPGVDLLLGQKIVDLLRTGDRIRGVVVRDSQGDIREFAAPLTVGADGRSSMVAAKSGLPIKTSKHGRFGYFAHYTGVQLQTTASSQLWFDGRGANYVFSNDDDRLLVLAMRPSEELPAFRRDLEANLLASFDRLPARPLFEGATRVSDVIGSINYPGHRRRPAGDGVALVGDAAISADFLPGVGCGWALQSAEWLVDATAYALLRGEDVNAGTKRYARRLGRRLGPHYALISDYATGRPFNALERLLFSAATIDDEVAGVFGAVAARVSSPLSMLTPAMLTRMVRARRRAAPPVDVPLPRFVTPAAGTTVAAGADRSR